MALPTLAGGITSLAVLLLVFRKQLSSPILSSQENQTPPHVSKVPMLVAILHLATGIILLAISDILGAEMYLICLILALSLTVFDLVYDLITMHTAKPVYNSLKKEPYELIPFVLSMFVIVLALKNSGATQVLSTLLITGSETDAFSFGFLSTFSANLLNNIPMSVLFEKIILSKSLPAVYGSIVGSNIGAFLTPVGALAGIMWSKILTKYDIEMPFKKFVFYGVIIAIPTLIASVSTLYLIL